MMIVPVLIVIVMAAESLLLLVTAIANRPQEGIEGLRGDLSPLLARRCVREAEMNPHVDASLDDVVGPSLRSDGTSALSQWPVRQ